MPKSKQRKAAAQKQKRARQARNKRPPRLSRKDFDRLWAAADKLDEAEKRLLQEQSEENQDGK